MVKLFPILFVFYNFINYYVINAGNCNKRVGGDHCDLPDLLVNEIRSYQPIVNKIVQEIVYGEYAGNTWDSLAELVDKFGSRMSGSDSLENAIDYVVAQMKKEGLENVHNEIATVPHWIRGHEKAQVIAPRKFDLPISGLGSSIGTPRGGLTGDVILVESFKEFEKYPNKQVCGKIVIFVPQWMGYEKTAAYRTHAASTAAKKGAIAALVRSVTPFSIGSLHTGWQNYEKGVKKIPVASITLESADMLLRMYRRGENVRIHLEMDHKNLPPAISRNTIGELQGSLVQKEAVVVVSGHLDSWDVGVGAMDDGGGAMISWKAVEILKKMGLRPKRTIRAILWTGEEQDLRGSRAYQEQHKGREKEEFNFFFESDMGTFEPRGLDFTGNKEAECIFKEILKLMVPLNATEFAKPAAAGPDIDLWLKRGFPGASLLNKNENYFWFHHTNGDSMLVQDRGVMDKCTALWAAASYIIADLNDNMPRDI